MELNNYIKSSTKKDFEWSKSALVSLARDLTLPKARHEEGLGERERIIENVLNLEACTDLLESVPVRDWEQSNSSEQRKLEGFSRMLTFNQEFSEELWLKVHHAMKPIMDFAGSELADRFSHEHWRPLGFLPVFTLMRVQSGESVRGKVEEPDVEMRDRVSLMSLWIVLSQSMDTFEIRTGKDQEGTVMKVRTGNGYLLEKLRSLYVPKVPEHQALVLLQTGVLFEKSALPKRP